MIPTIIARTCVSRTWREIERNCTVDVKNPSLIVRRISSLHNMYIMILHKIQFYTRLYFIICYIYTFDVFHKSPVPRCFACTLGDLSVSSV